jgi:WD40 repeat protein
VGQALFHLGPERFGYVDGNGICVVDIKSGPKEVIWRVENGISTTAVHQDTGRLAIAQDVDGGEIEVVLFSNQTILKTFRNPAKGKVVHMNFSGDGNLLVAITDDIDHQIIVWDMGTGTILVSLGLTENYLSAHFNPVDPTSLLVVGPEGLAIGSLVTLMDVQSIKLEIIPIVPSPTVVSDSSSGDIALVSKVSSTSGACWGPENRLFVTTMAGWIVQINLVSKVCTYLTKLPTADGASEAICVTCMSLNSDDLIVGGSNGDVYWFSVDEITEATKSLKDKAGDVKASQIASLGEHYLTCFSTDARFETLIIGSSGGCIFTVGVEKRAIVIPEDEEADDATFEDTAVEFTLQPAYKMQSGRTVTSASLCINSTERSDGGSKKGAELASLVITGSDDGILTFWKAPSVAVEKQDESTKLSGIRKTAIHPVQFYGQHQIKSNSNVDMANAITCIEIFSSVSSAGGRLIGVGTADGWVDILMIELIESDEDGGDDDESANLIVEVSTVSSLFAFKTPVSFLSSSKEHDFVAISSAEDSRVYIMSTNSSKNFDIIGSVTTGEERPRICYWDKTNLWIITSNCSFMYVLGGASIQEPWSLRSSWKNASGAPLVGCRCETGELVYSTMGANTLTILSHLPPASDTDTNGSALPSTIQISTSPELTGNILCICKSANGKFLATGTYDGFVNVWDISDGLKLINSLCLHSAPVISVAMTADSASVVSCAINSSMFITAVQRPQKISEGIHGVVSTHPEPKLSKLIEATRSLLHEDGVSLWIDVANEIKAQKTKRDNVSHLDGVKERITKIKAELEILLEENESAPDDEKLDDTDFIVDVARFEEHSKSNETKVKSVLESYKLTNARHEFLAGRIKTQCWDAMSHHARVLYPIDGDTVDGTAGLASFSVEKYTERDASILDKVKRLRAIEIRSMRKDGNGSIGKLESGKFRCGWGSSLGIVPPSITWLANDGKRWPCTDVILRYKQWLIEAEKAAEESMAEGQLEGANKSNYDDDEMHASIEVVGDIDESDVFNLLYPPVCLRTQVQKRNQNVLLREVVQSVKIKFNSYFEALCAEKEDTIAAVKSRHARIEEIHNEMNVTEKLSNAVLDNKEIDGSTLVISDSEIDVRPYETAAMRDIRLKEEEEKRRRDAESEGDNIGERALNDMMNGALEVKRDILAESSAMQKPDWMINCVYEDLSDLQKKEYDEFEANAKSILEEQAAYRKSLEVEVKKLKAEILDARTSFDEKLLELSTLKIIVHREILALELAATKHGQTMVTYEQAWKKLKSTQKATDIAIKGYEQLVQKIERFSIDVEEAKAACITSKDEETAMDKTFKRDLQTLCNVNFDQDALKIFAQLYHLRRFGEEEIDESSQQISGMQSSNNQSKKGSKKSSKQTSKKASSKAGKASKGVSKGAKDTGGMGTLQLAAQAMEKAEEEIKNTKDPFFETKERLEREKLKKKDIYPNTDPLSMEYDCPEGFSNVADPFIWSKLQELRSAKIQKEIKSIDLNITFEEKKKKLDEMMLEEAAAAADINKLRRKGAEINHELIELESSTELIAALLQGQDEIDLDAVITNYSGALLIPSSCVNKYNTRVLEIANEKIGVLTKIMQFRRKINMLDWESQHLKLESWNQEEYFTDLQLLRVTRSLQKVVREGSNAEIKRERLDKVMRRSDFVSKDCDSKLNTHRAEVTTLEKMIESKDEENEKLMKTIRDLEKQVASRVSVKKQRDVARGPAGDPAVQAMRKMKKVVSRRQLVDTARIQSEELDYLRTELDRIRQKTFPSFAKARGFLKGPDER